MEARFQCPICLNWLKDPILTFCGHRFCELCIYEWLEIRNCCPVDGEHLRCDNIHLFRDNYTSREISQQRIDCVYKQLGCNVQLSPMDIEEHAEECSFNEKVQNRPLVNCVFEDEGCTARYRSEEGRLRHMKANRKAHITMVENVVMKEWSTTGPQDLVEMQIIKYLSRKAATLRQKHHERSLAQQRLLLAEIE